MAFSDDLGDLTDATYDAFGVPVVLRPAAGGAYPVLGQFVVEDVLSAFPEAGRRNKTKRIVKVRCAELASLAGALEPKAQDQVEVAGGLLTIINPPRREDPRQLEWTLELG